MTTNRNDAWIEVFSGEAFETEVKEVCLKQTAFAV